MRLANKKIADGGTAHILLAFDITTTGKGVDAAVRCDDLLVRRAVIGHDNLITQVCSL